MCRQRKPANPVIRITRLDVKKVCAFSATIISWFYHDFFPFFPWLYFAISRKNLLVQLSVIFVNILLCSYWIVSWHLLRSEIKKKACLQARFSLPHSSCQLELVAPPPRNPQTLTSKTARRLVYRFYLAIVATSLNYYLSTTQLQISTTADRMVGGNHKWGS